MNEVFYSFKFLRKIHVKCKFVIKYLHIYCNTYLAFLRLTLNQSLPGSPGPGMPSLSKSNTSSMMQSSNCAGSQDSISTFFLPLSQGIDFEKLQVDYYLRPLINKMKIKGPITFSHYLSQLKLNVYLC